jgi:peptidoglycan/xylan/chitin deacetylase (PgdA/CDA1 family)
MGLSSSEIPEKVMSDAKTLLLQLYYYGSWPYRRWWHRRAAAAGRSPVVVLYYHRIADDRANPWTISRRTFARQIDWLTRRFPLVSLEEAQRRIRSGDNTRPCVSITFDDGYAENCREAVPLLIGRRIPFTYFVTLANMLEGKPFAHDVEQGNRFPPNDLAQIRAMAEAGVEIGAHTYDHRDLGRVTDDGELRREVVEAGRELQDLVGRPVRYFAFPFGLRENLTSRAFQLAREAGYRAVCSAYGGYNFPGDDPFHLQRISVDGDMIRLKNRVSVDPRHVGTPRFEYQLGPGSGASGVGSGEWELGSEESGAPCCGTVS